MITWVPVTASGPTQYDDSSLHQVLQGLRRSVATAFGNTKPNVVLQNDVLQLLVACAFATASGPTKYDDAPTDALLLMMPI